MIKVLQKMRRNMPRHDDGSITVESALTLTVLMSIMIAVIDYGLAFSERMEISNSLRSASQYALVRRASLSSSAEFSSALISLDEVKTAIVQTSDIITEENVDEKVTTQIYCLCAGFGGEEDCTALPTPCDSSAFIRIRIRHEHDMMFAYPGIGRTINFDLDHTVRLN